MQNQGVRTPLKKYFEQNHRKLQLNHKGTMNIVLALKPIPAKALEKCPKNDMLHQAGHSLKKLKKYARISPSTREKEKMMKYVRIFKSPTLEKIAIATFPL